MLKSLSNLHHANLLVGGREEAENYLRGFVQSQNFKIANNPDFFAFRMDTFGIDEARQLRSLSVRRAIGDLKIFLISPMQITTEAQNALLKTFEDPFPHTYFFLVAKEESMLEKTLLSRMVSFRVPENSNSEYKEAKDFIKMSIKDRLLFSKKFADNGGDTLGFIDDLLLVLKDAGRQEAVASTYRIRRKIGDANILPRLVLEHLSLVLSRA